MLSERRKSDRKVMADTVEVLLKRLNVGYTREEEARCIELNIICNELRVTVDFDGDSKQPDTYVLSWHMHYNSTKQLNDATFGGDVNRHHKAKATYVAYGFDSLLQQLESGLKMAIDGSAFL